MTNKHHPKNNDDEDVLIIYSVNSEFPQKTFPFSLLSDMFSFMFHSLHVLTLEYTGGGYSGILNVLALVAAAIQGSAWPVFGLLFGQVINAAGDSTSDIAAKTRQLSLYILFLAIAVVVFASMWNSILSRSAIERSNRLRIILFESLLERDTEWFDSNGSELATLTAKFNADIDRFRSAVGVRLGMFVVNLSQGILGVGLSFINGWQLSLLVIASIPLIAVSTFWLNSSVSIAMEKTESVYAEANAVCEESYFAIKTVTSFNGQTKQKQRHDQLLWSALGTIRRVILKLAVAYGLCNASFFATFSITFAFGGYLVSNNIGGYNAGNVSGTLIMIMTGAFGFGQTATGFQAFVDGLRGIESIQKILNDQTDWVNIEICAKDHPTVPTTFVESLEIRNVSFKYTASSPFVMSGINMKIFAGKKIGIVGESGTGKSSLVSLLMRFYDPTNGSVILNNQFDYRELNVSKLRRLFGYVGQEPVLFGGTIRSNLILGLSYNVPHDDEIWRILDLVNASEFVRNLPEQLDSVCGPSAGLSHLSGGQKQRIAIARALLHNPEILLLDEATSALDNESELIVMNALKRIRENRKELTIVTIAHRLSTVKDSDEIFVLARNPDNGDALGSCVVEQGTHEQLSRIPGGVYARLLSTQFSQAAALSQNEPTPVQSPMDDRQESAKTLEKIESKPEVVMLKSTAKPIGIFAVFKRIAAIGLPPNQKWMYLVGSIGSIAKGVGYPIDAILFSSAIGYFFLTDPSELMHQVGYVSLWYFCLGVGVFAGTLLGVYYFSLIGERVKSKLRSVCFNHILEHRPMEYFDDSKNSPAVLANNITCNSMRAAAFVSIVPRVIIEATSTMVAGVIISFIAAPKLAAVLVATFPILLGASAVSMAAWMGADSSTNEAATTTGKQELIKITFETFSFIRTIRSLGAEHTQKRIFHDCITTMNRAAVWKSIKAGTAFGVAMACSIFAFALGYWYGGILVAGGEITLTNMFRAVMGPMLTSLGIGEALAFLPDIGESLHASRLIVAQLAESEDGDCKMDDSNIIYPSSSPFTIETIEFSKVSFVYPQRPEQTILNDLSFFIPKGRKVAFVGPSGGGKSTILSILQRFYVPSSGEVIINGHLPIASIAAKTFRERIGFVSQEPVLFDMSVRDNVLYGIDPGSMADPNARKNLLEDIRVKAKLDFIKSEADWDMTVGPRGSRLSGGQKQRVAIARAIAKNPDIFMFDEATSALDSDSEALIQSTIEEAITMDGGSKSVITIAHRLSTIVNSDIIFVVQKGGIVEQGTHVALLANKNSLYANLHRSGQ